MNLTELAFFSRYDIAMPIDAKREMLWSMDRTLKSVLLVFKLYILTSDFDIRYSIASRKLLKDFRIRDNLRILLFRIRSSVSSIAKIFRFIFTVNLSYFVTLISIFLVNANKSAQTMGNNCKITIPMLD